MDFILLMVGLGVIYMLYIISLKFDRYGKFVEEQILVFRGYINTLLTYTIRNSESEKVEKTIEKPVQKKTTKRPGKMLKTFLSDLNRLPKLWMEKRKFWRLRRDGSITIKGERDEYVKRLTTTDVEDDGLRVKMSALKEVYGMEFVIVKNSNWYFYEPTVVPVIIKDNKVYGLHTTDDVDECGVAIPYRILKLFSSKIEMEKKLPPMNYLLEPNITSFHVSNLQPRAGWDEELTNILESMTGCAIYPYTVHLLAHKNKYENPIIIPEFESLAELKMKMELSRNELGK